MMPRIIPEHRLALMRVRAARANALDVWRQILRREQDANHHRLGIARRELEAVRAANREVIAEHKRIFRAVVEQMKAEAEDYKVVYLQAKREGKRLIQFIDRVYGRAA
ncbi:MAG: hypothetical protein QN168_14330 [Armatimonadota bacterium]|nr:hypothetical protein [Armatimonadota bacterium]